MAQSDRDSDWGSVVQATRLGDQLYHRLAGLIDRGEFAEGARLPPESELAGRFGVSRPVIREALSRLRVMGVIVSRKGSGSFVRARGDRARPNTATGFGPVSSLAEIKQCYEFRMGMEGEAAFLAAHNRTRDTLDAMSGALLRIENAIATGAVGKDADYEFHFAVARASGNEFFTSVMDSMRTPIEFTINLSRSLSLTRPLEHLLTIQKEHVAIYEAIEAGDGQAARDAMRGHISGTCNRVFDGPGEAER